MKKQLLLLPILGGLLLSSCTDKFESMPEGSLEPVELGVKEYDANGFLNQVSKKINNIKLNNKKSTSYNIDYVGHGIFDYYLPYNPDYDDAPIYDLHDHETADTKVSVGVKKDFVYSVSDVAWKRVYKATKDQDSYLYIDDETNHEVYLQGKIADGYGATTTQDVVADKSLDPLSPNYEIKQPHEEISRGVYSTDTSDDPEKIIYESSSTWERLSLVTLNMFFKANDLFADKQNEKTFKGSIETLANDAHIFKTSVTMKGDGTSWLDHGYYYDTIDVSLDLELSYSRYYLKEVKVKYKSDNTRTLKGPNGDDVLHDIADYNFSYKIKNYVETDHKMNFEGKEEKPKVSYIAPQNFAIIYSGYVKKSSEPDIDHGGNDNVEPKPNPDEGNFNPEEIVHPGEDASGAKVTNLTYKQMNDKIAELKESNSKLTAGQGYKLNIFDKYEDETIQVDKFNCETDTFTSNTFKHQAIVGKDSVSYQVEKADLTSKQVTNLDTNKIVTYQADKRPDYRENFREWKDAGGYHSQKYIYPQTYIVEELDKDTTCDVISDGELYVAKTLSADDIQSIERHMNLSRDWSSTRAIEFFSLPFKYKPGGDKDFANMFAGKLIEVDNKQILSFCMEAHSDEPNDKFNFYDSLEYTQITFVDGVLVKYHEHQENYQSHGNESSKIYDEYIATYAPYKVDEYEFPQTGRVNEVDYYQSQPHMGTQAPWGEVRE